ncbi:hypothetical protein [Szabonella alba]|uniref:Uncharacterized protein n=1 Tax=Szabonella alba TaxID=2804194 RepID=A0A8K0Y0I0_9RHOB|nr:hypothetical protein [Szabonella alba]MBL4916862.1 hypothetical protein [Szabonella alba]
MNGWKTTDVIPCVGSNGEKVTIIAQIRDAQNRQAQRNAQRVGRAAGTVTENAPRPAAAPVKNPETGSHAGPDLRYVLGNGLPVAPLDTERFLLPKTKEIVIRR